MTVLRYLLFLVLTLATKFNSGLPCDLQYLPKSQDRPYENIRRFFQIYDSRFFNHSCPLPNMTSIPNPWDTIRPHPRIAVFLHIGLYPLSTVITHELIDMMKMSGLLDEAELYVGSSGTKKPLPSLPEKTKVSYHEGIESGEYATYRALLEYVDKHEDGVIFYLHTKGSQHNEHKSRDWRQFMMFYNVWLFRWALIMLQYRETYGVSLDRNTLEGTGKILPPYYSGNYFWSTVRYLKTLNHSLYNRDLWVRQRTIGEQWLLSGKHLPFHKVACCLIHTAVFHYWSFYPSSMYTQWPLYNYLANYVYQHRTPELAKKVKPTEDCVVDCRNNGLCNYSPEKNRIGKKPTRKKNK